MPHLEVERPLEGEAQPAAAAPSVAQPFDEAIPFSADQLATLRDLAESQNINLSQAVGQAIDIAKMVVGIHRNKGERLLLQRGQQLQELTLQ